MKNIRVIVALHKQCSVPEDDFYLPLRVGAAGKDTFGYAGDNTGDNISDKNPFFCELTGLYWAWKNLDADYIGLVHYRRYFASTTKRVSRKNKLNSILTKKEADALFKKTDIILPKKRKYYIENLYNHYARTMYVEPLDIVGEIINEKYPEYFKEYQMLKKRKSAHVFNMFIMKKDKLDEYCTWLFDILFELEKRIDATKYTDFHARLYGRLSERMLDIWLRTKGYSYEEVPALHLERVNWIKKGSSFLFAKFFGKKYEKSF